MKTNGFSIMLFVTVFLIFTAGCAYPIRYDGPYEGKVVDADTSAPIEGVVVLGVWYKEEPNVAGATSTFYDARETLTDEKGEFKIPGQGLKILSNVGTMNVLIFKSGYEYKGLWTWEAFKEDPTLNIKWEGEKTIIPLRKLTMEDRRKQGTPSFPSDAYKEKKIPLLLKEINKEEKQFGRPPYPEE